MLSGDEKRPYGLFFVLKRRPVTIFYTKIVPGFRAYNGWKSLRRCPLGEVIPTRDFSQSGRLQSSRFLQCREAWEHGATYRYRLLRFVIIQPLLR